MDQHERSSLRIQDCAAMRASLPCQSHPACHIVLQKNIKPGTPSMAQLSLPMWFAAIEGRLQSRDVPLAATALIFLTKNQLAELAASRNLHVTIKESKPGLVQSLLGNRATQVSVREVWEALPPSCKSWAKLVEYCKWHGLPHEGVAKEDLMDQLVEMEEASIQRQSRLQNVLRASSQDATQVSANEKIQTAREVLSLMQAVYEADQRRDEGRPSTHSMKLHAIDFWRLCDLLAVPCLAEHYRQRSGFITVASQWLQLEFDANQHKNLDHARLVLVRLARCSSEHCAHLALYPAYRELRDSVDKELRDKLSGLFTEINKNYLQSRDIPLASTALECLSTVQLKSLASDNGLNPGDRRGYQLVQLLLRKGAVTVRDVWHALPANLRQQAKLAEYCRWHGLSVAGDGETLMARLVEMEEADVERQRRLRDIVYPSGQGEGWIETKGEIAHEVLSLMRAAHDADQRRGNVCTHVSKLHAVRTYRLPELLAIPCLGGYYREQEEFLAVTRSWLQVEIMAKRKGLEATCLALIRLAKEDKSLADGLVRVPAFHLLSALAEEFSDESKLPAALQHYVRYASYRREPLEQALGQTQDQVEERVIRCILTGMEAFQKSWSSPMRGPTMRGLLAEVNWDTFYDMPLASTALMLLSPDQLGQLARSRHLQVATGDSKLNLVQSLLGKHAVSVREVWKALPPSCTSGAKLVEYCAQRGLNNTGRKEALMAQLVATEEVSVRQQAILQDFCQAQDKALASRQDKEIVADEVLSLMWAAHKADESRDRMHGVAGERFGPTHTMKLHTIASCDLCELLAIPCLRPFYQENKRSTVESWLRLEVGKPSQVLETVRLALVRVSNDSASLTARLEQLPAFQKLLPLAANFHPNHPKMQLALSHYVNYESNRKEDLKAALARSRDDLEQRVIRYILQGMDACETLQLQQQQLLPPPPSQVQQPHQRQQSPQVQHQQPPLHGTGAQALPTQNALPADISDRPSWPVSKRTGEPSPENPGLSSLPRVSLLPLEKGPSTRVGPSAGVGPLSGVGSPSGVGPSARGVPSGVGPSAGVRPSVGVGPPSGVGPSASGGPSGVGPSAGVGQPSGVEPQAGVRPPSGVGLSARRVPSGVGPSGGARPPSGVGPPAGAGPSHLGPSPGGVGPPSVEVKALAATTMVKATAQPGIAATNEKETVQEQALHASLKPMPTVPPAHATLTGLFASIDENKLSSLDIPLASVLLACLPVEELENLAKRNNLNPGDEQKGYQLAQLLLRKGAVTVRDVWHALPANLRQQAKLAEYCRWHGLRVEGDGETLMARLVEMEEADVERQRRLRDIVYPSGQEEESSESKEVIAHEVLWLMLAAHSTDQRHNTHFSKLHAVKAYELHKLLAIPCLAHYYSEDKYFSTVAKFWLQMEFTVENDDVEFETTRLALVRLAKNSNNRLAPLERLRAFQQLSALAEEFPPDFPEIPAVLLHSRKYGSYTMKALAETFRSMQDGLERKVVSCAKKGLRNYQWVRFATRFSRPNCKTQHVSISLNQGVRLLTSFTRAPVVARSIDDAILDGIMLSYFQNSRALLDLHASELCCEMWRTVNHFAPPQRFMVFIQALYDKPSTSISCFCAITS
eukprot:jgi/Mesvir1/29726/Mv25000-RA.1